MRKHTRLTFLMLWHIFAFLLSCQDFLLSAAAPYIPLDKNMQQTKVHMKQYYYPRNTRYTHM